MQLLLDLPLCHKWRKKARLVLQWHSSSTTKRARRWWSTHLCLLLLLTLLKQEKTPEPVPESVVREAQTQLPAPAPVPAVNPLNQALPTLEALRALGQSLASRLSVPQPLPASAPPHHEHERAPEAIANHVVPPPDVPKVTSNGPSSNGQIGRASWSPMHVAPETEGTTRPSRRRTSNARRSPQQPFQSRRSYKDHQQRDHGRGRMPPPSCTSCTSEESAAGSGTG